MRIKDIFVRDLNRRINGVVKAEQLDQAVVWQELDEFVVTREISKLLDKFFQTYVDLMDHPDDPAASSQNGVWISGFFGSGKSHFLKILSYLLEGFEAKDPNSETTKKSIDFLKTKIEDPLLFNNIRRAINGSCDVMLFNIDSKADVKDDKQAAILSVFSRVFNELRDFSGQYPHVAELEFQLQQEGLLERFQDNFAEIAGQDWCEIRDLFYFKRDQIIEALTKTWNMSKDSAEKWFDNAEQNFVNSPELFAKRVRQYLDSRSPDHRIVFLVDEMGQFIGSDGRLMLNLQTIVEDLGIYCGGRAWVVVTSQEDIDAAIGSLRTRERLDFSKIQGRFKCRLSLSSSNTDEVIQSRLLEKKPEANIHLGSIYEDKRDILRHQLSFTDSSTMKTFIGPEDFSKNYPFIPYQYEIVQKVFEMIRTSGVTGAHLSRGERSMLDSFQLSAREIASCETGALVPIYGFYLSIEGYLDTSIKRTIDQAKDNLSLKPMDIEVLKALFLIRQQDLVKPNIDNIVTLCITEVDTDKIRLKNLIEESLNRLEKETLINRSGQHYFFMTDEEREVGRQIKNIDLTPQEEIRQLSELVYDDLLKAEGKHKYSKNKKDFGYNRFLDGSPHSSKLDNELTVEILSPLFEGDGSHESTFITRSSENQGQIVIKVSDHPGLISELKTYMQTEKFLAQRYDKSAPDNLKKILDSRKTENLQRRQRLIEILNELLPSSDYYVCGTSLKILSVRPKDCLSEALDYLISNVYTKLTYLKKTHDDQPKEIRLILTTSHWSHESPLENYDKENADALHEIQQFIVLSSNNNQRIELTDIIKRFTSRPYGWPEWEIVILVARLFAGGKIRLLQSGARIDLKEAVAPLTKSQQWKQLSIQLSKEIGKEELDRARNIGKELFGEIAPGAPDDLYKHLQEKFDEWKTKLERYKLFAETGKYPGKSEIENGLSILTKLTPIEDHSEFISNFISEETGLKILENDLYDLTEFHDNQKNSWDQLQSKIEAYKKVQQDLESRYGVGNAIKSLREIIQSQKPYSKIKDIHTLQSAVNDAYSSLLSAKKLSATKVLDSHIGQLLEMANSYKTAANISNKALAPLQFIKKEIEQTEDVAQISYLVESGKTRYEEGVDLLEQSLEPASKTGEPPKKVLNVHASNLLSKTYIENESDVNEYIERLKKDLLSKIKQNVRIRII